MALTHSDETDESEGGTSDGKKFWPSTLKKGIYHAFHSQIKEKSVNIQEVRDIIGANKRLEHTLKSFLNTSDPVIYEKRVIDQVRSVCRYK